MTREEYITQTFTAFCTDSTRYCDEANAETAFKLSCALADKLEEKGVAPWLSDKRKMDSMAVAMEFGFKEACKGHNLDKAFHNFRSYFSK